MIAAKSTAYSVLLFGAAIAVVVSHLIHSPLDSSQQSEIDSSVRSSKKATAAAVVVVVAADSYSN